MRGTLRRSHMHLHMRSSVHVGGGSGTWARHVWASSARMSWAAHTPKASSRRRDVIVDEKWLALGWGSHLTIFWLAVVEFGAVPFKGVFECVLRHRTPAAVRAVRAEAADIIIFRARSAIVALTVTGIGASFSALVWMVDGGEAGDTAAELRWGGEAV